MLVNIKMVNGVDPTWIESWKEELARATNSRTAIISMIDEWKKGCGNVSEGESPLRCEACTAALIIAINNRALEE